MIFRYHLSRKQLLPPLWISGKITSLFASTKTGEMWCGMNYRRVDPLSPVIQVFEIVKMLGGDDLPYVYRTSMDDADAPAHLKLYNALLPQVESGKVTIDGVETTVKKDVAIWIRSDGVDKQTVVVNRDRHLLEPGNRGKKIQLAITGTAVVEQVEYEFTTLKPL